MEYLAILCVLSVVIVFPFGVKNSTKDKKRKIEKRAKALGLDLKFDK